VFGRLNRSIEKGSNEREAVFGNRKKASIKERIF